MPDNSVIFLITGASRGLGRATALTSANYYCTIDLEELKDKLDSMSTDMVPISARYHVVDLGKLDNLDANLNEILRDVDSFASEKSCGNQQIIFINNAGSLGHLGPCTTSPSLLHMRRTLDLNITSCLWSSVKVAQHIKRMKERLSIKSSLKAILVNISSLVAISDDFVTMGIYSAGKGARDKYHTFLAKEEQQASSDPSHTLMTLNYAPGPLETDMTTQLRESESLDYILQQNFDKQLLDANDSAMKLIRLLDRNDFERGVHVDYIDLPDNHPPWPR